MFTQHNDDSRIVAVVRRADNRQYENRAELNGAIILVDDKDSPPGIAIYLHANLSWTGRPVGIHRHDFRD
jgi:hypothetical protein